MLFVYFLMLVLAANAENEQITSALEEIKNMVSSVNLRLDGIEDQQKNTKSMYNRHEEKLNCIHKEQSESFLWQKYTVSLVKEQKVNDEGLETRQNAMMSQLNQLVSNTDRCCRDNITATCVGPVAPLQARQPPTTATPALQDCKGVADGVYQLAVGNEQIPVYCADGFMTFQRRYNGELRFDKTFVEFEQGFGSASSEHWMGLRYLHLLTKDKKCTFRARFTLEDTEWNKNLCGTNFVADCDGQVKEIVARDFQVSSAADKYQINVVLKNTNLLNSIIPAQFKRFNGKYFGTKDQDNDQHGGVNCATWTQTVPGGFWYDHCAPGYPNSVFSSKPSDCTSPVCGNWWPYFFTSSILQFSC